MSEIRCGRRTARLTTVLGVVVALLAGAVAAGPMALAAPATPGPGYVDFRYPSPGADDVTAYHNQSKVWFTDGSWYSVMIETTTPAGQAVNRWAIFRLDFPSQTWVSTGVAVDPRNRAHPDVFWDEAAQKLYVASSSSANPTDEIRAYVYTLTANPAGPKTYVLDPALKKPGPDGTLLTAAPGVKFASITKANGALWIAYTSANAVNVMSSPDGITWSAPSPIATDPTHAPIAGGPGATAESDDVAAVTPVPGGVGVMWTRSSTLAAPNGGFFFATSTGGAFTEETVTGASGALQGDNHLSLRTASNGRVFAGVKTSNNLKAPNVPTDALIEVLVREVDGTWSVHPVSTVNLGHTRPLVALDEGAGLVRVFTSRTPGGGDILESDAPIGTASFTLDSDATVISSSANPNFNDPTSTKQPVNSAATGLIVIVSDVNTQTYGHACAGTACPTAVTPAPAAANTPTTTTLTQSSGRTVVGGVVTLTASVGSAAGAPGGSITFLDGATPLDDDVAVVGGTASLQIGSLALGGHSLSAIYTPPSGAFASSRSAALVHGVVPAGSRFQATAPTRVMSGRTVGPRRFTTLRLRAPAGARAVALNVIATAASRSTGVAACAGNASAAACRAGVGLHAGRGQVPAAAFSVVPLGPGNTVRLFNSAGRTRLVADVQGWYVTSPAQAHLTALAAGRAVVRARAVTVRRSVVVRVPAALRPAGTTSVAVTVTASTAARTAAVAVCSGGTRATTCRARPVVYAHRGANASNQAVVRLGRGGTLRLAVAGGPARVSVVVDARHTVDLGGSALQSLASGRAIQRRAITARRLVTVRLPGLSAGATAAAVRVTASSVRRNGSVSVCAGSASAAACRATPALVVHRGRTTSSTVFVLVGAGAVRIYSTARLRLTVDRVASFGRG